MDLLGHAVGQTHLQSDAFCLTAHVGKDQGRPNVARRRERGPGGDVEGRDRAGERCLDPEVDRTQAATIDDLARSLSARYEAGDPIERSDRSREPDAQGGLAGQFLERFQQQAEVRAALVAGQRVHLVENDRLHVAQRATIGIHRQHDRERLRCGDQNVRRSGEHQAALFGRRIARSNAGPHVPFANPSAPQPATLAIRPFEQFHLAQRSAQVVFDVVAEGA